MPDNDLYGDDPDDTTGPDDGGKAGNEFRKQIKRLEAKAAEAEKAAARAEAAERKLRFAEAGLNLQDPKMKYFIAGYDGELDAEKIKKAATDAGFLTAPEPPAEAKAAAAQDAADQEAFGRLDAAADGAPPASAEKAAALVKGQRDIYEQGGTTEDVARFLSHHGYPVADGY